MAKKVRLDHALVLKGLVPTLSQAESYIRLGRVKVDNKVVNKPLSFIFPNSQIQLDSEQFVSRAALKLASVADKLNLRFIDKVILDVGSSTGGFTDFALRRGASKAIAVELGTNQMHPSLRNDSRIELHEQTDIRSIHKVSTPVDMVVIDVSFVSLRDILPHIAELVNLDTQIVAMCKPQFEAPAQAKAQGVIKNDTIRRDILKNFETWSKRYFIIVDKADSDVTGEKGNRERFYLLQKLINKKPRRSY